MAQFRLCWFGISYRRGDPDKKVLHIDANKGLRGQWQPFLGSKRKFRFRPWMPSRTWSAGMDLCSEQSWSSNSRSESGKPVSVFEAANVKDKFPTKSGGEAL